MKHNHLYSLHYYTLNSVEVTYAIHTNIVSIVALKHLNRSNTQPFTHSHTHTYPFKAKLHSKLQNDRRKKKKTHSTHKIVRVIIIIIHLLLWFGHIEQNETIILLLREHSSTSNLQIYRHTYRTFNSVIYIVAFLYFISLLFF